jgi:TolB-like protein/Flp pilus assembly protein TadD
LLAELKRRNVIRVGVLYVVAAWLAMQIADVGMSTLGLPEWTGRFVLLLLAVGFIPTLVFSWVYELTPEGIKREKDIDRTQSITGDTGRKLNIATVVVVILGVAIVAVDRLLPERAAEPAAPVDAAAAPGADEAPTPEEPVVEAPTPTAEANSIAVLPFVNMSGDPENEYFADGLTEELLNVLAKMEGLRVAARTSSFRFKGQVGDMAEIGRQLRVGNVLEGSVRKSGNKVRVTAQLIQVEDGFHLWSETYDRELDDIFVIQDDIASHVGEALKVTLLGGDEPGTSPVVSAPTQNLDAYATYLRGQQQLAINSYDSYEKAEAFFREAIRLDPGFGAAHSGLAKTWSMKTDWGAMTRADAVPRVADEAQRALAIDDKDPAAWAMRGWAELRRLNLSTAERQASNQMAEEHLRRALAIEPGHSAASEHLAELLLATDRGEEALASVNAALARDPVSGPARMAVASVLMRLRRLTEAREQVELAIQLAPDDPMGPSLITLIAERQGDYAEAIIRGAELATGWDTRDPEGPASVALDYMVIGDLEAAEAWTRLAESMDPDAPAAKLARASVLWFGGRRNEAFEIASASIEADEEGRMGSRAVFSLMVRNIGIERADYDLALSPYARFLDEAIDPEAELVPGFPVYMRSQILVVLRARGDGALADRLGRETLDWLDSGQSGYDEFTRSSNRALYLRAMGRSEDAFREYEKFMSYGGSPIWMLWFDEDGSWHGLEGDPAIAAFRERRSAWQAEQRRILAESGREPPRPVVEKAETGT